MDYFSYNYDDKKRWMSYFYQVKAVFESNPKKVLVIGKGNGLVPEYLQLRGLYVKTLDSNKELNPDITASVLNIPLDADSFDVVLCAEVLEHLPYSEFNKALSEIKRVAKNGAVISLPHFGPAIRFLFKFPLLPEIKFMIKIPYPKRHQFKEEHHWEIGKRGYRIGKIKEKIRNAGLIIEKDYVIFENPLHHFFILRK